MSDGSILVCLKFLCAMVSYIVANKELERENKNHLGYIIFIIVSVLWLIGGIVSVVKNSDFSIFINLNVL